MNLPLTYTPVKNKNLTPLPSSVTVCSIPLSSLYLYLLGVWKFLILREGSNQSLFTVPFAL
jgi:hypothetical protein